MLGLRDGRVGHRMGRWSLDMIPMLAVFAYVGTVMSLCGAGLVQEHAETFPTSFEVNKLTVTDA